MFGVANQLLATVALCIGTTIIMKYNRNRWYGLITFLPMLFMLTTTLWAGVENIFNNYLPQKSFNGNLNATLSIIMLVLAVVVVADSLIKWVREIKLTGMTTTITIIEKEIAESATIEKEPALEVEI